MTCLEFIVNYVIYNKVDLFHISFPNFHENRYRLHLLFSPLFYFIKYLVNSINNQNPKFNIV